MTGASFAEQIAPLGAKAMPLTANMQRATRVSTAPVQGGQALAIMKRHVQDQREASMRPVSMAVAPLDYQILRDSGLLPK